MNIKIVIFWDVPLSSLLENYQRFKEACCPEVGVCFSGRNQQRRESDRPLASI
jgi:hypothetical protein